METVEFAPAKINLALHVRRRRPDGYHDIETLFAFARDGDRVAAASAETLSLTLGGPFAGGLAADESNLVLRAAVALRRASGTAKGARLHLVKQLPVASGIGGGSADAAATLRLLSRLWNVAIPPGLAEALGADVPACLLGRTAWADGRGYPPRPIADRALGGTPLLLVNPGVPLSTATVFGGWDGVDRGGLAPSINAAFAGRNDLEAPAQAAAPIIRTLLADLASRPGATLARMSGSGATCFALFETAAARDHAAGGLKADWPDAWCLQTALA